MECKACGTWYVSGDKSGVCHTCKRTLKNMGIDIPYDRLLELVEADREGRCVVLSEPMKPMVYKTGNTDVYCPNCGETLSGGWPLSDADDHRKLCQCPKCGQAIDDQKCEAAEHALKGDPVGPEKKPGVPADEAMPDKWKWLMGRFLRGERDGH